MFQAQPRGRGKPAGEFLPAGTDMWYCEVVWAVWLCGADLCLVWHDRAARSMPFQPCPTLLPRSEDLTPSSFYVVRIISKAPCMVLRLGFPIGTPAQARNKVRAGCLLCGVGAEQEVLNVEMVGRSKATLWAATL